MSNRPDEATVPPAPRETGFRRELRRAARIMVQARWPVLALIILLAVTIAAAFGPLLAPSDPNRQNLVLRLADPMASGPDGTVFWLGSDALGRDVLSRLLYGARVSLLVGIAAIAVGGGIGIVAGRNEDFLGNFVTGLFVRSDRRLLHTPGLRREIR